MGPIMTPSKDLERLARALCGAQGVRCTENEMDRAADEVGAILRELMNPSEEMVDAVANRVIMPTEASRLQNREAIVEDMRRMIRHVLGE